LPRGYPFRIDWMVAGVTGDQASNAAQIGGA